MKISVAFRAIPDKPGWSTGEMLIRAFQQLGHDAQPYAKVYLSDQWIGQATDVDLLVYCECNDGDPQYQELSELNCTKVYWEFDTEMHSQLTRWFLSRMRFDKIFMASPKWAGIFSARYLPYAVDPCLFFNGETKRSGAAILGSPFNERKEFAKAADIDLISNRFTEEYSRAIRELLIHVHNFDSGGDDLIVMRPWETMGSGTCLLAPYHSKYLRHFIEGEHIVFYSDAEDCKNKVQWLLKHEDRRARIARHGYDLVMTKHTYINRARAILGAL